MAAFSVVFPNLAALSDFLSPESVEAVFVEGAAAVAAPNRAARVSFLIDSSTIPNRSFLLASFISSSVVS